MFMLAGPNGAGKSTLYETRIKPTIPPESVPFINADVIQRDELKDASMKASYRAAEIAEARRRACLAAGKSFVSESTFSHASKLDLIRAAADSGFRVVMYHVNVRSADLSVMRVASRRLEGGHDVPAEKIRERYARNQALIREAVMLADRAFVYDNSVLNKDPQLAIDLKRGQVVYLADRVPGWVRELYASQLEKFSPARLNAAAASFADAKAIVGRVGGPGAQLRIRDNRRGSVFRGEIVGESAEHWVQRVGDGEFLAHFRSALSADLKLHGLYEISYERRGSAAAHEVAGRHGRALAFEAVHDGKLSREDAAKQFPELRPLFNALSVAKLQCAGAPERLNAVRKLLQAKLDAGEIPNFRSPEVSSRPEPEKTRTR